MEVVIPALDFDDFNFGSACSTPFASAPSTPKRFGEYSTAPTSPAHASDIYSDCKDLSLVNGYGLIGGSSFSIPTAKPKSNSDGEEEDDDDDDDFAFDFSGQTERDPLYAEELFDGGVIRPLTPPSRLQFGVDSSNRNSRGSSPRSPKSPKSQGRKTIRDVFSPRWRKDADPFAAAIEEEKHKGLPAAIEEEKHKGSDQSHNRGRERAIVPLSSRSGRRGSRSHSPLRILELPWEEQQQHEPQHQNQNQNQQENTKTEDSSISKQSSSSSTASSSSSSSLKGSRKWRLRDLLLFRSASEGRASEKDPLRKYTALPKHQQDLKNYSSFRKNDSPGLLPSPSPGQSPRRKGTVSAHELIYTANRAVSEDMKKKTFLPYKQGVLSVSPLLTRAFNYFTRNE